MDNTFQKYSKHNFFTEPKQTDIFPVQFRVKIWVLAVFGNGSVRVRSSSNETTSFKKARGGTNERRVGVRRCRPSWRLSLSCLRVAAPARLFAAVSTGSCPHCRPNPSRTTKRRSRGIKPARLCRELARLSQRALSP